MRTDYLDDGDLEIVLALLTPPNRLACQLAIHTGLRIGDVLGIRTDALQQRMSIVEAKTGKKNRIYVPSALLSRLRGQAGSIWVFPGRCDETRHRTRQAVWADIKRAQRAIRLPANVGPHTMRKVYAVRQYRRSGNLTAVQRALQHSDQAVTMLYAMADHLTAQRMAEGTKRRSK